MSAAIAANSPDDGDSIAYHVTYRAGEDPTPVNRPMLTVDYTLP